MILFGKESFMSTQLVLKALNVTREVVARSESGITWTSEVYPSWRRVAACETRRAEPC
jgi:hypothetical protein